MNKTLFQILICIALLPLISACENTATSDGIRTSGMSADFEVVSVGNGIVDINAQLRVGSGGLNGTVVDLEGGDVLYASHEGQTKRLRESNGTLTSINYSTSFNAVEGAFNISFSREDGISAPNSIVTLPEGFSIESPANNAQLPSDQAIQVSWSPSGYARDLDLSYDYSCTMAGGITGAFGVGLVTIEDVGSLSITAQSLSTQLHSALAAGENCSITLQLERSAVGTLDSAYGSGGSFKAIQRRIVEFRMSATN